MVPGQSAFTDRPTTQEAEREVTRSLCVLWSDGELRSTDTVSPRGRAPLATVASHEIEMAGEQRKVETESDVDMMERLRALGYINAD